MIRAVLAWIQAALIWHDAYPALLALIQHYTH